MGGGTSIFTAQQGDALNAQGQKVELFGGTPTSIAGETAPPPAPDLTDEQVQATKLAALRRLSGGNGLSSTFLTGPMGTSAPASGPNSAPKLGAK